MAVLNAQELINREQPFIGGHFVEAEDGVRADVVNPADQSTVGRTTLVSRPDMDRAVMAARESFDDGRWRDLPGQEKAAVLRRAAEYMDNRLDEIAVLLTSELGCPLWFSQTSHVPNPIRHTRFYADLAETQLLEEMRHDKAGLRSLVVHEPVGVVAAVTPWNGPLSSPALKVMPALAAGCSVVLKPATQTPLSAFVLADALRQAGLPEGVLSVVPAQRDAAQALIAHPEVDKIGFTGSTEVGKQFMKTAADRVARVSLELGGRSAAIILDDADIAQVVQSILPMALHVNGQMCISQSRILVPRRREAEFKEAFASALDTYLLGDPMDASTKVGPLVSESQRDRVVEYIALARNEGAQIITGGGSSIEEERLQSGWFVPPTLLADADNGMRAVREEIFGPVIALIPYDDEGEAVRIANDSPYGLSGSVWSADPQRAVSIARLIRTGMVSINGAPQAYGSPFGGFKESGIGREMGVEGFRLYLETKSIALGLEE